MSAPVEKAIKGFKLHPSILLIKNIIGKNVSRNLFCFNKGTKAEVLKKIIILKVKQLILSIVPSKKVGDKV